MKLLIISLLVFLYGCETPGQQQKEETQAIEGAWVTKNSRFEMLHIYYQSYSFFIVRNRVTDSFNGAGIGTYRINGNRLVEKVIYSAWGDTGVISTSTVSVHGDTLFSDVVDSLKGRRLAQMHQQSIRFRTDSMHTGDLAGLWFRSDIKQSKHGDETVSTYQLITPTYWFRLGVLSNKTYHAMAGSYSMKHDTIIGSIEYSSLPVSNAVFTLTGYRRNQFIDWMGEIKDSTGSNVARFRDTSTLRITL